MLRSISPTSSRMDHQLNTNKSSDADAKTFVSTSANLPDWWSPSIYPLSGSFLCLDLSFHTLERVHVKFLQVFHELNSVSSAHHHSSTNYFASHFGLILVNFWKYFVSDLFRSVPHFAHRTPLANDCFAILSDFFSDLLCKLCNLSIVSASEITARSTSSFIYPQFTADSFSRLSVRGVSLVLICFLRLLRLNNISTSLLALFYKQTKTRNSKKLNKCFCSGCLQTFLLFFIFLARKVSR